MANNPLELDPESMRRLGYRAVDAVVDYFRDVASLPVVDYAPPESAILDWAATVPERPSDAGDTVERALDGVLGNTMRVMHPRFFAYIPGPGNFVSALADFLVSGFNVFAGTAPHNLPVFEIERATIDWLGGEFGWDFPSSGLFVSGGSAASLTALAVARHVRLADDVRDAVVYCSSQTHSSVERALFLLGFRPDQLRQIEPDEDFRLQAAAVSAAIEADRAAGRRPFCLVANGGTTNTGAVDPLDELAGICEEAGLWFHIDAAYGGGAVLAPAGKAIFAGAERAHTIAIDPHKWMFQPFECACVLGREQAWFRDTFRRVPEYMRDTDATGDTFNYRDMGLQVTRAFKAFKLWLSLQVYGAGTFRAAVEQGLALARYTEQRARSNPGWEVITPATLGVVNCRWRGTGRPGDVDGINARMARQVSESGYAYITTTRLRGRTALRFCPIHPATTEADIDGTFDRLEKAAASL